MDSLNVSMIKRGWKGKSKENDRHLHQICSLKTSYVLQYIATSLLMLKVRHTYCTVLYIVLYIVQYIVHCTLYIVQCTVTVNEYGTHCPKKI